MVSRNIVVPAPISQEDAMARQRNQPEDPLYAPEEVGEGNVRYDEGYVSPRRNIRLNIMDHMSIMTSQMS